MLLLLGELLPTCQFLFYALIVFLYRKLVYSSPNLLNVFTSFVKWKIDGPRCTGPRFPSGVVDYSLISIARISEPHAAKIMLYQFLKRDTYYLHSKTLRCHLFGHLKPEKKYMSLFLLLCFGLNLFPLSYLSRVKDHLLSDYFRFLFFLPIYL